MLTDRLNRIKKFYKVHKRLPSYSEMLRLFNLASKNAVYKIIQKLIEAGFIKKEGGKIAPDSKFFALPLVGLVKAGFPILAEENREYLTLDDYLIGDHNSSFLLKVSGDSLMGLGIFEGDIVVIEKKRLATSGDIVLAQIDREWTLKILKKDGIRAYLEAANPKYPPFYPKQNLEIFGVVKAVMRKFN